MNIKIVGQPMFYINLTPEQIALMIKCAKGHYSGECLRAAHEDGFLQRWKRCCFGDEPNIYCTQRELDIVCKCFEVANYLPSITHSEREEIIFITNSFSHSINIAQRNVLQWVRKTDYTRATKH